MPADKPNDVNSRARPFILLGERFTGGMVSLPAERKPGHTPHGLEPAEGGGSGFGGANTTCPQQIHLKPVATTQRGLDRFESAGYSSL